MIGPRRQRKFNGVLYTLVSWYPSKVGAQEKAQKLRDQGRLARVVKLLVDKRYITRDTVYGVYWRKQ